MNGIQRKREPMNYQAVIQHVKELKTQQRKDLVISVQTEVIGALLEGKTEFTSTQTFPVSDATARFRCNDLMNDLKNYGYQVEKTQTRYYHGPRIFGIKIKLPQ